MAEFLQYLINGLTLGSIYGLIAIGYTMVFGIIGMVNFAHGDVFMLSGFIALIIFTLLTALIGVSAGAIFIALLVCLILGMFFTSIVNWAIERVAYRPLRGSFRLAPLISAIGMSLILINGVQVSQGADSRTPFPGGGSLLPGSMPLLTNVLDNGVEFTTQIAYKQILIFVVTAVLLSIFWYVVQRTPLGRAQRACEQDRKMASLLGIDVDRTISITFIMGASLAAIAGVLWLVQYNTIVYSDGFIPGVKAFTAAVLGGIGSLPGAVIGGILIGLVEAYWAGYVSSAYSHVASFTVLIIMLIFLPQGILGKPEIEKV
jgi:branched-chain amino acid transport system permease protein